MGSLGEPIVLNEWASPGSKMVMPWCHDYSFGLGFECDLPWAVPGSKMGMPQCRNYVLLVRALLAGGTHGLHWC